MTNNTREYFMQQAINLAGEKMRANEGGPFGAVVVKDGKIIGRGWNKVTSTNDPTAHAEIVAIREACQHLNNFWLDGCDIYCSSEPCPMCLCAIYWARINKIFYAATQKDAAKIGFDDAHFYHEVCELISRREIPMSQLLQNEILKVFEEWDAKEDKIMY